MISVDIALKASGRVGTIYDASIRRAAAEPMVFGLHEMRAARAQQQVVTYVDINERLATHAGWLPLLDS